METVNPRPLEPFIDELLSMQGTDLHLTVGSRPLVRVDGSLRPVSDRSPLQAGDIERLADSVLTKELMERMESNLAVDFSFSWNDAARFRGNLFMQRGSMALALRWIPFDIPTFDDLRLPAYCSEMVKRHQGFVLLTGPTGSGKSTTLASMVDWINTNRPVHILTVEDPIEYVHEHKMGIVNQRELGIDVPSFADALRSGLREDPDVVVIGEMRDIETIHAALTIAETGHLVFATLHTNDTTQAIDRIVDVFSAEQQTQIKVQLAGALEAVIYQRLIPRIGGGRIAAFEVLTGSNPVRNLVREGRTRQLRNAITTGQKDMMQTLEMSLNELIRDGLITRGEAAIRSLYPQELIQV
jgi:twitching motility protein PilT